MSIAQETFCMQSDELIISMDRVECIARELLRLYECGQFSALKLRITESNLTIIPLAEPIRIVLSK